MMVKDLLIIALIITMVLVSIVLLILTLFKTTTKNYRIIKICLIIHQLVCGIATFSLYEIIFDKQGSISKELLTLSALLINTISLIIFLIKNEKIRKEVKSWFSIVSIIAILCGIAFLFFHAKLTFDHMSFEYDNNIREILNLENYSKEEAKVLFNNLTEALRNDTYDTSCLRLYSIWKNENADDDYFVNLHDECMSDYLPANAMHIVVNNRDKTKIEKVYWQFNDEIKIVYYENNKQVSNFKYLYAASFNQNEPADYVKEQFEKEVKKQLKSPSSAIFTYDGIRYSPNTERFLYEGWVESQNSFGAMVRTDFVLKITPCTGQCDYYNLGYTWEFTS